MYTSMMMRMRISELVTLWWKTCPDIEEETPTTGSHKNLPINKQCKNTYKFQRNDHDGDACTVGNEYVTSSSPFPFLENVCILLPKERQFFDDMHSSVENEGNGVMELRYRQLTTNRFHHLNGSRRAGHTGTWVTRTEAQVQGLSVCTCALGQKLE